MPPKHSATIPIPIRIQASPLTPEGFSPFGHIIQNPSTYLSSIPSSNAHQTVIPTTVNQGTARKYLRMAPLSTSYPITSPRATPNINLFVCSPRKLLGPHSTYFPVKILERHPYTTQTFVPLGLSRCPANSTQSKYLVIVAPSLPAPGNPPDLQNLKAFIAYGNQGVTYAANTWHAPMVALGERDIEFVVINYENGVGEEDLEECIVDGGGGGGGGSGGSQSAGELGGVVVEMEKEGGWLWQKEEDGNSCPARKARL